MSASSDMHNKGYFARLTKNRDHVMMNDWYPSPGAAADRLIIVMRAAGWPVEDTPEAEQRMRNNFLGGDVVYGKQFDVGGGYLFTASSGDHYAYELVAGYRPGYNPETGQVESSA